MQYRKGTFVVVPNKEYLQGKKPILLAVFYWLCTYADEYGECFPSRQRLAKDCDVNIRTVDQAIKELEELCLIEKSKRKNEKGDYTSNLYQIICLNAFEDNVGVAKNNALPSEKNSTRGSEKNSTLTKSNIKLNPSKEETETSSVGINELIKTFEVMNPSCSKYYGNKTQRKACENLIELYGFNRVKKVIEVTLPKTNTLPFFPSITTPVQLQEKWSSLESAIRKYQSKQHTEETKKGMALW